MEQMERVVPEENRIEKIITHDGIFHTDEVFAHAILKDLFPESMELVEGGKVDFVKYLRTRSGDTLSKAVKDDTTMVIDVGGEHNEERFNLDHHQSEGAGARENGIKYASAGLIWKKFGKEWIKYIDIYAPRKNEVEHHNFLKGRLTDKEIDMVWKLMDKNYVQLMDSNDTGQLEGMHFTLADGTEVGGKEFTLPEIVRAYNIDVHDGRSQQDRFNQIVEIFRNFCLAQVNKYINLVESLRDLDKKNFKFLEGDRGLIIEEKLDPELSAYLIDKDEALKNVEYYAVSNGYGGFNILAAPTAQGKRQYRNRNMIPEEFRTGKDTKKINQILGLKNEVTFAHTAGYFASCRNFEAAKRFIQYCLRKVE